jgi:hypothetical protein
VLHPFISSPRRGVIAGHPAWVLPGASFDFQFMYNRYWNGGAQGLSSVLSTTRASVGLAQRNDGTWASFASGAPRVTDKGLLVEESRTNSIRNSSAAGAVVGNPGTVPTNWSVTQSGLTRSIVGTGTENGLPYVDIRLNGTITAATADIRPESGTQIISAAQNDVWTGSVSMKVVAGSLTGLTGIQLQASMRDSSGTVLGSITSPTFSPTANLALYSSGGLTLTNASTAFVILLIVLVSTNGNAIDVTLRVAAPQMEKGAFATSPILTTTGALTRAADNIKLAAPTSLSIRGGTIYTSWLDVQGPVAASARTVTARNTNNNRVTTGKDSSNKGNGGVVAGGTTTASMSSTNSIVAGQKVRVAMAYTTDDFAAGMTAALNSGILTDSSGAVPNADTTDVWLGSDAGTASFLNGYVRHVAFTTRRVPNTELLTWAQQP